ncbi:DUF4314 domain-containing protein [Listeria monocytogenes]|nr:DUF4314 domain-containing protein [Listeria monocytogenes]EJF2835431.1 DUF4314 domain-containing protein [Listeria monocytogenes]
MNNITKESLTMLKKQYQPGTRVRLIEMDDPYSSLVPGDEGTVSFVDDIGTIHIKWDKGSSLGIVFGVDKCLRIEQ